MSMFFSTRAPIAENSNANPLDVIKIKSALGSLGHYEAPDWGVSQFPDSALFQAIRDFQKAHGLKVDGVMKPEGETLSALQSRLRGTKERTATQTAAQSLQDLGRNGDEILAHLSQAEAQLLHDITDGGSINPHTGLLEFWFGFGDDDDTDSYESAVSDAANDESLSDNDFWSGYESSTAAYDKANSDGVRDSEGVRNKGGKTPTPEKGEESAWDRFIDGTKNGWKNTNSEDKPRSGDYDETRRRTLGYNDFLKGGMYGALTGEAANDKPDYDKRRAEWNLQNPDTSDASVVEARAKRQEEAAPTASTPSTSTVSMTMPSMTSTVAASVPTGAQPDAKIAGLKAQLADVEAAAWRGGKTPAAQARNIRNMQNLKEKIKKAEAKAQAAAQKARSVFGPTVQVADASGDGRRCCNV